MKSLVSTPSHSKAPIFSGNESHLEKSLMEAIYYVRRQIKNLRTQHDHLNRLIDSVQQNPAHNQALVKKAKKLRLHLTDNAAFAVTVLENLKALLLEAGSKSGKAQSFMN